jgi:hypothetical protein
MVEEKWWVRAWRWAWGWVRALGLAPFGFTEEVVRAPYLLLCVWGPFLCMRYEVWRWSTVESTPLVQGWLSQLPAGSSARYERIRLSAERIYKGRDWMAAISLATSATAPSAIVEDAAALGALPPGTLFEGMVAVTTVDQCAWIWRDGRWHATEARS